MIEAGHKFSDVQAVGRILDLRLPDSDVVKAAYERAFEASEPWLFNHVVRSWLFSVKLAQAKSLTPDQELLAISVLLHDLGLAQGGAADRRFEVVGADLGRDFALHHGIDEHSSAVVWDAIALHTTASIAHFKGVNVACCQFGIACDYGGFGYEALADKDKQVILDAFPRLMFKETLTACVCGIAERHPESTWESIVADFGMRYVSGYQRPSPVDFLLKSPYSE